MTVSGESLLWMWKNEMKVYVVLKTIINSAGFSIGSDRIEKIFDKREKAEEYVSSEEGEVYSMVL